MRTAIDCLLVSVFAVGCAAHALDSAEESARRGEFTKLYRDGKSKAALEQLKDCRERDSLLLIAKVAAGDRNGGVALEALEMLLAIPDDDSSVTQYVAQAFQGGTSFERKVAIAAKMTGLEFKYHACAVMAQYIASIDYCETSKEAMDRIRRQISALAGRARRDMSLLGKIRSLEAELESIKKNPEKYDAKRAKYETLVNALGSLAGTSFTFDNKLPATVGAWWGAQQHIFLQKDRTLVSERQRAKREAEQQAAGK